MYWEDVYSMYELASNSDAIELNREMKFNSMLHAQSKEQLENWTDIKIPFPDPKWREPKRNLRSNLPANMKIAKKKATPERLKRMEEIREKMAQHKLKVKEVNDKLKRDSMEG